MSSKRLYLWCFFVFCLAEISTGAFNLYIDVADAQNLFGWPGQMFYIREGEASINALDFRLKIPNDMEQISYSWQQTSGSPLNYSIEVVVSDETAVFEPVLSIPLSGRIPAKPSRLSTTIRCNGQKHALVYIDHNINISTGIGQFDIFSLKSQKRCQFQYSVKGASGVQDYSQILSGTRNGSGTAENPRIYAAAGTATYQFYIAVGCACLLILLIAGIVACVYMRAASGGKAPSSGGSANDDSRQRQLEVTSPLQEGEGGVIVDEGQRTEQAREQAEGSGEQSEALLAETSADVHHSASDPFAGPSSTQVAATSAAGSYPASSMNIPPPAHSSQSYLRAETPSSSVVGGSQVTRAAPGAAGAGVSRGRSAGRGADGAAGGGGTLDSRVGGGGSDVQRLLAEISVSSEQISIDELIQEVACTLAATFPDAGTFGRIHLGVLTRVTGDDDAGDEITEKVKVYVKTVSPEARADQVDVFLSEGCMLRGFVYEHLNSIMAACLDDPHQPLLLYAHSNEGNLKKFLQRCRISDLGSHVTQTLNTQQLVYMAIQIVRATQYLHRKKFIHCDLATRNCVVSAELIVKVTDNALSRDLFPNDYHCLGDNENRPIKWMSLEALERKQFSAASDVWSFGVVLWELMTLGQQPYADIDPFEMGEYLREGYRMSQPGNCPDELFAVMACCWALTGDERPKLSQLLHCLHDFYMALGRYI